MIANKNHRMQNEPAVIDQFKKDLVELAGFVNGKFDSFPTGGGDRRLLADDIWTSCDRFALVESKYSEKQIETERIDKSARIEKLCFALSKDAVMAKLHETCHRIAWRQDNESGDLMVDDYRRQTCCVDHKPTCAKYDCNKAPMKIAEFAADFFDEPPKFCLESEDFVKYVEWLMISIGGEISELLFIGRKAGMEIGGSAKLSLREIVEVVSNRHAKPSDPRNTAPEVKKKSAGHWKKNF